MARTRERRPDGAGVPESIAREDDVMVSVRHGSVRNAASEHGAQWTPAILDAIEPFLVEWRLPVHDCFAGVGERLGQLCDRVGVSFSGTEIEAPFIVDPRVKQGDATDPRSYPAEPFAVVCSPTYGNGCNDDFKASNPFGRNNYRAALHRILGHDQPLHPNNQGKFAVARRGKRSEARYWEIAGLAVRNWGDHAIVNVKDFYNGGRRYPLVRLWRELLEANGYAIGDERAVPTPGDRYGANRDVRVDHEMVLVAERVESSADVRSMVAS